MSKLKLGLGRNRQFNLGMKGGGARPLSPNVAQFFARLAPGETVGWKAAVAGIIDGLGPAFNRLDWLYFRNATVRTNATVNARQALYPSVQTGGFPDGQHTPGVGFTGDGNIGHYNDNGCDPTVEVGLNFTLNVAAIGVHVKAGAKSGAQWAFGNGNFYVEPYFTDTLTYWRANGAADLSVASPATLTGTWHVLRTGVNASKLRKDGVDLATSAAASSAMKNQSFKSLGFGDASTLTLDIEFGGGYTQADADLFDALIPTFFP